MSFLDLTTFLAHEDKLCLKSWFQCPWVLHLDWAFMELHHLGHRYGLNVHPVRVFPWIRIYDISFLVSKAANPTKMSSQGYPVSRWREICELSHDKMNKAKNRIKRGILKIMFECLEMAMLGGHSHCILCSNTGM